MNILKSTLPLLFTVILLPGFHSTFGQENQSCVESISLFNGKDLSGWYTFLEHRGRNTDPKKVFTVEDGLIRISGEEWGCITTLEEYANYKLIVEFKWGKLTFDPRKDKARDSGLLLHSRGKDGGSQGIWMHSIECQIIEGGTGDFIVVGDGSEKFQITCTIDPLNKEQGLYYDPEGEKVTVNEGRINWYNRDADWQDVLGFRGRNDIEHSPGAWNRLECLAEGDELRIQLNGMQVNLATQVSPSAGRIQIQSEGAEIFIRRVDLIPLH